MSDAEVKNDVAAEAPTAEELKAKKRSAEVYFLRYSTIRVDCVYDRPWYRIMFANSKQK